MSPTFSNAHPTSSRNFRNGAVTALMSSIKTPDQLPLEKAFVRRSHQLQMSCTIWMIACPHHVWPNAGFQLIPIDDQPGHGRDEDDHPGDDPENGVRQQSGGTLPKSPALP